MRQPQMSFLRLLLLHVPPAFSTTFRHVCSAFVSCAAVAPSPRRSTRRWCTNLNKKQELALRQDEWKGVSDVLVCGDGDLSYSAWLTQQLGDSGVSLTATVLESKEAHNTGASIVNTRKGSHPVHINHCSTYCHYFFSVQEFSNAY